MFRSRKSAKPSEEMLMKFSENFPIDTAAVSTENMNAKTQQESDSLSPLHQQPAPSFDLFGMTGSASQDSEPLLAPQSITDPAEPFKLPQETSEYTSWQPVYDARFSLRNSYPNTQYYPSTPGGTGVNTLLLRQAGDLHTPNFGLGITHGLGTPLSLPNQEVPLPPASGIDNLPNYHTMMPSPVAKPPRQSSISYDPFNVNAVPPSDVFMHSGPSAAMLSSANIHFGPISYHQPVSVPMIASTLPSTVPSTGSAPSITSIPTVPSQITLSPSLPTDFESQDPPPIQSAGQNNMMLPLGFPADLESHEHAPPSTEKFRYHVALNTKNAIGSSLDDILSVCYLNRGQIYTITVTDRGTPPSEGFPAGIQYRTFIRVSFDSDERRVKSEGWWLKWKEIRLCEATQRKENRPTEAPQRTSNLAVEYQEASQTVADAATKPTVVELKHTALDGFCVIWSPGTATANPEVKINVRFNFLSTDFSNSKGVRGVAVRLCAKTNMIAPPDASVSCIDTTPEICYCRVKLFRDHGAERKLLNDVNSLKKNSEKTRKLLQAALSEHNESGSRRKSKDVSRQTGGKHKRSSSQHSILSLTHKMEGYRRMYSMSQVPCVFEMRGDSFDDPDQNAVDTRDILLSSRKMSMSSSNNNVSEPTSPSATGPMQVSRHDGSGSISAMDVDSTYQLVPASARGPPPAACLYVARQPPTPTGATAPESNEKLIYRAVYLAERTARELVHGVAAKWNIDPASVSRVLRVLPNGLEILIDDDVVLMLPDGQDMILSVKEVLVDGAAGGAATSVASDLQQGQQQAADQLLTSPVTATSFPPLDFRHLSSPQSHQPFEQHENCGIYDIDVDPDESDFTLPTLLSSTAYEFRFHF